MLDSAAANIFLIVASACIVLVTLMAAAVSVGLLLAVREVRGVTRRAKRAFDRVDRIEHELLRDGTFVAKWFKFFTRHLTHSPD